MNTSEGQVLGLESGLETLNLKCVQLPYRNPGEHVISRGAKFPRMLFAWDEVLVGEVRRDWLGGSLSRALCLTLLLSVRRRRKRFLCRDPGLGCLFNFHLTSKT